MATVITHNSGIVSVKRTTPNTAVVHVGVARVALTMEELRYLTNECADVLDVWFTEREENGKA